jgi:putative protease
VRIVALAEAYLPTLSKEDRNMSGIRIGHVTHYFDRVGVAVLSLTDWIRVGDTVHILGHSTDFQLKVTSLQIEHQPVSQAGPGQDVALKVNQRVHADDAVFKISEGE